MLLFDEPESALLPQRQLVLLAHMIELTAAGRSQFIIATHSPILLTFPVRILSFDDWRHLRRPAAPPDAPAAEGRKGRRRRTP
jgi:predicted ATPase